LTREGIMVQKIITTIVLLIISITFIEAQQQQPPKKLEAPKIIRNSDDCEADRPTPPLRVRLPVPEGTTSKSPLPPPKPPAVPVEVTQVPVPPPVPPVEVKLPEEAPEPFFGKELGGDFVFVLDRSGSMNTLAVLHDRGSTVTRMDKLKEEAIKCIMTLSKDDKVAINSFGAWPAQRFMSELVPATEANKTLLCDVINALRGRGATPAYSALRIACTEYGNELDSIFFLCDGQPNMDEGAPGGSGDPSTILSDFSTWFRALKDNGCMLHVFDMSPTGVQFMLDLATMAGGTYTRVD